MKDRAYNQIKGGQNGFAMLFSVLVSSVLLSIGLSIFNLTVKELVLSSSGRESQFSFYAADTGAECAIYWDFKGTNIFAYDNTHDPQPVNPSCVDGIGDPQYFNIAPEPGSTELAATTKFQLDIPKVDPKFCAKVTVKKTAEAVGGIITTEVDSRGYNAPCLETLNSSNSNLVERALRVRY